jgi:hypothetical protein
MDGGISSCRIAQYRRGGLHIGINLMVLMGLGHSVYLGKKIAEF